jgi:hypothetical protein
VSARRIALAVLAVAALLWLGERLIVSDEERLDALWIAMTDAVRAEDRAALDPLLHGAFAFRGPPPVGDGQRDEAWEKLSSFWEQANIAGFTSRRDLVVQGAVGTIAARGNVRFEWGGGTAIYKYTLRVDAVRAGDGFIAQGIEIDTLAPGLF